MTNDQYAFDGEEDAPYISQGEIDFSFISTYIKQLPFFNDDLFLGMQAINVGITDQSITNWEYEVLSELFRSDKTPEATYALSAFSQMWIYGLYEALRIWRDRRFQLNKLYKNGGIESKIDSLEDDDPANLTLEIRIEQLKKYKADSTYRDLIETTWAKIEPIYRMVELFRINLAKHSAPGKDNAIPRAPGYGRINRWCGALDYELINSNGSYEYLNRRDIADSLRVALKDLFT